MKINLPTAPDLKHIRYCDEPFPSYRFIPGESPHPVRDPDGHSYGKTETKLAYISPEGWQKNRDYLFGVDLYNFAYWWEAHEAWEGVWHTTDKDSFHGQFLQGLIQIAAAFIKWHLHQSDGLVKLYDIGMSRLESVEKKCPVTKGLDLAAHIQKLKRHFAPVIGKQPRWGDPLRGYPFIVLEHVNT